ncbi:hypothetical protein AKJ44_01665 [candidate division MSBL1 archaeon SCGC-AAA261F17]|uniref:Ribonuclease VapC n=1 Tax=candidate division MSBL1 archaeon SCGC-AAA261F17 TaxID=1698274 RepID=A0A133V6G7_9EURY|nr:hypothetical protein AKJ44_01665 [candidate division MSBL1 archaeon SCGC-AAA261F17]
MAILDTDLLIGLLREKKDANKTLKILEDREEPLRTTTITAMELYVGAWQSSQAEQNVPAVDELLGDLFVLSMTSKSSRLAGKIIAELEDRGEPIGTLDCAIGAIARSYNETIWTRNTDHFERIEGVQVESW